MTYKNGNIKGLGIDLEEVRRFKLFKPASAFARKIFSPKEIDYCFRAKNSAERLAGNFAAKEAVVKASGGKFSILEIEITRSRQGQPEARIRNKLDKNILISISHTAGLALGVALIKK